MFSLGSTKQDKKNWKLRRVFGRGSRQSSVSSTATSSSSSSLAKTTTSTTGKKSKKTNIDLNNSMGSPNDELFLDEPPLTPLELSGYKASTHKRLLSTELGEEIRLHIPSILQISHSWSLIYSLEQNGASLNTLYNSSKAINDRDNGYGNKRQGYILCVMDENHSIFGCYLNEYLRPMDRKRYYGNGDCFLWKSEITGIPNISNTDIDGEVVVVDGDDDDAKQLRLKVFPYTSLNDFIIYSDHELISIGSGNGKFGLYINSDLDIGFTDFVETFGNEPLTSSLNNKFRIVGLELWKID